LNRWLGLRRRVIVRRYAQIYTDGRQRGSNVTREPQCCLWLAQNRKLIADRRRALICYRRRPPNSSPRICGRPLFVETKASAHRQPVLPLPRMSRGANLAALEELIEHVAGRLAAVGGLARRHWRELARLGFLLRLVRVRSGHGGLGGGRDLRLGGRKVDLVG